jgi:16S rRNA A1518/A1519 N6-dimethyltransferase RsmA/KsgA/DIM1 with predicted DNA glycosylase/AP lyase activity
MGFAQPRKTLVNNLVAGYQAERTTAQSWVEAIKQKTTARPAELTLDDWVNLEKAITAS